MLDIVRAIANYQFRMDKAHELFPDGTLVEASKNTGRPRRVYLGKTLLATVRANDGMLALTIEGARRLREVLESDRFRVVVRNDVANLIASGASVFSKHIVRADDRIMPGEEVLVEDEYGNLIAVGRAILSGSEMVRFKRGLAVKVRDYIERRGHA